MSLCIDPPASVVRPSVRPSDRPTVRPSVTNLNIDNISDTINFRIMKLGQTVVLHSTFNTIPILLTLTKSQGHRVRSKMWKLTNFIDIQEISDTFRYRVMKLGHNIKHYSSFNTIPISLTLIKSQGHRVRSKMWKLTNFIDIQDISDTFRYRVMKLGHHMILHSFFNTILISLTLTKAQGHRVRFKMRKLTNFVDVKDISHTFTCCVMKLGQNVWCDIIFNTLPV